MNRFQIACLITLFMPHLSASSQGTAAGSVFEVPRPKMDASQSTAFPNYIKNALDGDRANASSFTIQPVSKSELIQFLFSTTYLDSVLRRVVETQNALECQGPMPPDMDTIIQISDTGTLREVAYQLLMAESTISKSKDQTTQEQSYRRLATNPKEAATLVDTNVANESDKESKCVTLTTLQTISSKKLSIVHNEKQKTIVFLREMQRVLVAIGKGQVK